MEDIVRKLNEARLIAAQEKMDTSVTNDKIENERYVMYLGIERDITRALQKWFTVSGGKA
jgi:hypothetical protein